MLSLFPLSFLSICTRYRFVLFNLACSNDKYGGDCEYSCGHCYNNAYCDRTGRTCSNGCKRGYRGSDCKQRKCFYFFHESNDIVEWKKNP